MISKSPKGFTLIELLVVVAIISLLSSVVLAALKDAREKAQASKLTQDVLQLRNAIELYKLNTNQYPLETSPSAYVSPTYSSQPELSNLETALSSYIKKIPSQGITKSSQIAYAVYMVGSSATTPTYTCGSETIKSYIFYIYSEAKLNLPKLSSEFMISPGNTNWYCIGT